ncbi:MAG TPA: cation transporter [Betaproteobacteria bacterium]|nr:cation transporter [Betaproteobacteria bacterium]
MAPQQHAHVHAHAHAHSHAHGGRALRYAVVFTLAFAVVEVVGGVWSGSLALVSDAGHMLSDSLALALAAFAAWIAHRPPSRRHTYGFARAEVIAAFFNSLLMLLLIVGIVVEAIQRLLHPASVAGAAVMVIAFLGLLVNIVVAIILGSGGGGINVRSALLHVMGDLLGSLAALTAGAVIYYTGWMPIDPILSLVVAGLILFSTIRLLREALHVLMEGVPVHLSLEDVGLNMAKIQGVTSVHDLHIWTLAGGMVALSAHVVLGEMAEWPKILAATRRMLHDAFGIDHVTLQPETTPVLTEAAQRIVPLPPHRGNSLQR